MTLDEIRLFWDNNPQYTSEKIEHYYGDESYRRKEPIQIGLKFVKIICFYCEDQKNNIHVIAQVMEEVLGSVLRGCAHTGHYGAAFFLSENDSIRFIQEYSALSSMSDLFQSIFRERYPEIIDRFRDRLKDHGIDSTLEIITEDRILARDSSHTTIIPQNLQYISFLIPTADSVREERIIIKRK